MDRYEMRTVNARFASNIWVNPRNNEARLYINGLGNAKVWLTEGSDGRSEIHWRGGYMFGIEDAHAALDNALRERGLHGDVMFHEIVSSAIVKENAVN